MKGLSINIIKFSEAIVDEDFRLESEYFNSKNVIFDSVKGSEIEEFSQYGTSNELNEENKGFPVLRLNEFDTFFISQPAKCCNLLSNEAFESLKLKKDDVLICRTNGNPKLVGKAAIVPKDYDYAFASYVYRLRPNTDIINSATLVAFMNSKYGRIEIEKYSMVGNQANFSPAKFRQISIPVLTHELNNEIESLIYESFELFEKSKSLYSKAKDVLLSELGMKYWEPQNTLCSVKRFSTFTDSGRFDAEYYQSKYDELLDKISNFNCKQIREIQIINYRGTQPEYVEGGNIEVINSKHILEDCLDYENFEKTNVAYYNKTPRSHISYGDVLIYTTGANIGRTQVYLSDKKAIASNHVNILRVKDINPVYLALVLNSKIGRMQTERACTGTAQAEIYPDDIADFIVPVLSEELQNEIASLVGQSLECKQQSKLLQQSAIQMVEEVIEKYRVN